MSRKTIKLHHSAPIWVRNRMTCGKYGFYLQTSIFREYHLFAKFGGVSPNTQTETSSTSVQSVGLPSASRLTAGEEYELTKRCDRIVGHFLDPYAHESSVRIRLHNMMQGLSSPEQRAFVQEYMDENFPVDDKKKKAS